MMDFEDAAIWGVVFVVLVAVVMFISSFFWYPRYKVWSRGLSGKAQLREAEWNRKITIEEAAAKFESAKHLAAAEVERAKGVAKANKIIGESLQGNEAYLRYLWIHGLQESTSDVIYVPTEANLPVLEAQRFSQRTKLVHGEH